MLTLLARTLFFNSQADGFTVLTRRLAAQRALAFDSDSTFFFQAHGYTVLCLGLPAQPRIPST